MMSLPAGPNPAPLDQRFRSGFTLVELIVVMLITSVAALAIVMNYISQTKTYAIQREMAHMQQNLRAAMYIMQNDIRNSGRDPLRLGRYGITDILNYNADTDDPNGYPGLTLTSLTDQDGDGFVDEDAAAEQQIQYQVMDLNGDGRRELCRQMNAGGWVPIIDGIEDIGFAFSFDDGNGDLARFNNNANGPEIWAFNNNGANVLDTNLDTTGDGNIDVNDDLSAALNPVVELNRIRAVRIWLLARSRTAYTDFVDRSIYVVGGKQLDLNDPANAGRRNFRHLMTTGVVALQNFQLDPGQ